MQRTMIILILALFLASCGKNNPLAPNASTIRSDNLNFTFSIPQSTYGINDTLKTMTTAYNPGDTTVNFYIPDCWPILWFKVQDISGTSRLKYTAPRAGCNSLVMYSIPPHQSKQIFLLNVKFPIDNIDGVRNVRGLYVLTVANGFGKFTLQFTVK